MEPWKLEEVDGSSTWVGSNEDWRARTIATCRQRDELVEMLREVLPYTLFMPFSATGLREGLDLQRKAHALLAKHGVSP